MLFIEATHVRVVCDSCRTGSAEICGRRELPAIVRAAAVTKFRTAGWHHDAGSGGRARSIEHAERDGSGRWYCPACCRTKHL